MNATCGRYFFALVMSDFVFIEIVLITGFWHFLMNAMDSFPQSCMKSRCFSAFLISDIVGF